MPDARTPHETRMLLIACMIVAVAIAALCIGTIALANTLQTPR